MCDAVGDDHAAGDGTMSHELRESGDGTRLHLEVGYAQAIVLEALDALVEFGLCQWQTEAAALRTEEAIA